MAFLDNTGAAYLINKIKDNTLTYRGSITASSNLTELTAGMYTISGVTHSRFPTTDAPYYGMLIQTGGTYKTQMLIGGLAGESRCYSRRWVSGTTWTSWTKTVYDSELSDFSGSYNDLTDKPTNISAFTNDSGYLTLATLPIYDGSVT